MAAAKDPKNCLARVHGMIATALEGATTGLVGWLPAHLTANELGVARKSDGSLVLPEELEANDLADQLAKRGAEFHRVAKSDVDAWAEAAEKMEKRAVLIAKATYLANNRPSFPQRDSEASRWKADAAARRRREKKQGTDGRRRRRQSGPKPIITVEQGGHTATPSGTGRSWMCSVCRIRTGTKRRLRIQKCGGAGSKWSDGAGQAVAGRRSAQVFKADEQSRKHAPRRSGNLI